MPKPLRIVPALPPWLQALGTGVLADDELSSGSVRQATEMPGTSTVFQGGPWRALQLLPLLAAALVVCVYLTYGMDRSLWLDEANSVHIASGSSGQIIDSLSHDISPPLYYFLLSGWIRLFGNSEITLRLLSCLFDLGGICLLWFLGRMLFGREGAPVAAFLYAVNPIVGRQTQNVRMYTMLSLIVALSMIVFVILVRDKKRRTLGWFALFGVIAFLGMNTHYWFAFVLIAYGSWVLLTWRAWRVRGLVLLGAFTALPFLLVDLTMFLHQSQLPAAAWTPRATFTTLMKSILANFGINPQHRLTAVGTLVVGLLILGSLLVRRGNWHAAQLRNALFPGFLYAVALGVPFFISMKKPMFWPGRYDIIAVPFFVLLGTSLLLCFAPGPRIMIQLLLAASCLVYFVREVHASETTNALSTLDPVPLGDRAAASVICAEAAPGDFVIFTGLSRAAISYYLQRFGCDGKLKQVSYPAEFGQHLGWEDPKRDYSQEPANKRDAKWVVDEAYASGARIFLLFQQDARLSAGIVAPIGHRFRAVSSRPFTSCAKCFEELRVYAPNFVNVRPAHDVPY